MKPTVSATDWTACDRIRTGDDVVRTAIGDVHGHVDALAALYDFLPGDSDVTLLGDLGDRGPDSPAAFRLAATGANRFATFVALPGNHEQMLVGAFLNPHGAHAESLFLNGGDWAVDLDLDEPLAHVPDLLGGPAWDMVTQAGTALDPAGRAVRMHRRLGDVVLVHAGLRPGVDPDAWIGSKPFISPDDDHPLWIRDEFLRNRGPHGRRDQDLFVIHGHTQECTIRRHDGRKAAPGTHVPDGWRLGVDGGSFRTGIVTAAQFRDGAYRVVTAKARAVRTIAMDFTPPDTEA